MKSKYLFLIPVVIYSIAIFWVSHQPGSVLHDLVFGRDKLLHLIAYFIYHNFVQIAVLGVCTKCKLRNAMIISFAISILFSVSDEFHQSFIPGRDASVLDMLANFVGISIALLLAKTNFKIVSKLKEKLKIG